MVLWFLFFSNPGDTQGFLFETTNCVESFRHSTLSRRQPSIWVSALGDQAVNPSHYFFATKACLFGLSNAFSMSESFMTTMPLDSAKRLQLTHTPTTPEVSPKAFESGTTFSTSSNPSCSSEKPIVEDVASVPRPSPSRKRTVEDVVFACKSPLKKQRVEGWLKEVETKRATSCPPRLEETVIPVGSDPKKRGEQQRPLLQFLQEMSQSQKSQTQSLGGGSGTASSRSERLGTSNALYRQTLRNNGVYIDYVGSEISQELRTFLRSHILKERSSKLSPEVIARAVKKALDIADGPEINVYDLTDQATLPIKRDDVGRGGDTPWHPNCLPRDERSDASLAIPKPDIHCGYPMGRASSWTQEENVVIAHTMAVRITQPAKGNSFPFFILELKSEAMGGTLWQAENQAAGSGACCVNIARWIFEQAYPSQTQSVLDSIAFSACLTHRRVYFFVHFYSPTHKRYYMSSIADFDTFNQVQQSHDIVQNIFDHCLGDRQTKIRDALTLLFPFPSTWKNSRSASTLNS